MGRVEENSEAIAPIIRAVQSPYVIGSVQSKEFELSLLCDISKSLADIADKMAMALAMNVLSSTIASSNLKRKMRRRKMWTVIELAGMVLTLVFILAMIAILVVGGVSICWGIILELMDEIQERENKDDQLS